MVIQNATNQTLSPAPIINVPVNKSDQNPGPNKGIPTFAELVTAIPIKARLLGAGLAVVAVNAYYAMKPEVVEYTKCEKTCQVARGFFDYCAIAASALVIAVQVVEKPARAIPMSILTLAFGALYTLSNTLEAVMPKEGVQSYIAVGLQVPVCLGVLYGASLISAKVEKAVEGLGKGKPAASIVAEQANADGAVQKSVEE